MLAQTLTGVMYPINGEMSGNIRIGLHRLCLGMSRFQYLSQRSESTDNGRLGFPLLLIIADYLQCFVECVENVCLDGCFQSPYAIKP